MRTVEFFAPLVGRVFLGILFLFMGYGKIMGWDMQINYMSSKGLNMGTPVLLGAAMAIELLCGAALVVGFRVKEASLILFLFLGMVTVLMHAFWNSQNPMEAISFMKNLGIMGGLMMLAAHGPGPHVVKR
ncbi:MAG: DoxX family protein [Deltaproteobacteria bacterium]|nr:DoxX family protein [Deltaproteobacteria bacterium]